MSDLSNIELFRQTPTRKLAVGFVDVIDLSDVIVSAGGRFLQVRDITDLDRQIITNFDLSGRLISIELGEQYRSRRVPLLHRSFNGEIFIYDENCKNLKPEHEGVYYYYDYYAKQISKDTEKAKYLISAVLDLLQLMFQCNYQCGDLIEFFSMCIEGENIVYTKINHLKSSEKAVLSDAKFKSNWDNLSNNVEYRQAYTSPITILPPDTRPDINPAFLVLQATQGCLIKKNRGACNFCSSYNGIAYKEKSVEEFETHIEKVKIYVGRGMKYVKKVFIADADPLYTSIDSRLYFSAINRSLPKIDWYEAFVSTLAILSKSKQDWIKLKELGLKKIYWGVESADNQTLKFLGKPQNLKTLRKAATILDDIELSYTIIILSGINNIKENSIDNPHIAETAKFINGTKCQSVYVSPLVPQQGTKIFDLIANNKWRPASAEDSELEYRRLIELIKHPVKGSYGEQFVPNCP